jgi:hypothetical protein
LKENCFYPPTPTETHESRRLRSNRERGAAVRTVT